MTAGSTTVRFFTALAGSCRSASLLLCGLYLKLRGTPILHRLQVLTIEHQFSWDFEHFVRDTDHPQGRIFRPLFEMSTNRVDRVSDKNRFDEPYFVIPVTEGINIVVRHQTKSQTEHHRTRNEPAAKNAFFLGEDLIRYVGVHVENQAIKHHAFPLRDGAANGTRSLSNLEVFIEPVLRIPDQNILVFISIGIGIFHECSSAFMRFVALPDVAWHTAR